MIEVKTVKEMVSLSIGTKIFVVERRSGIIKLDIGKVSVQEANKIKIYWGLGRNVWYNDSGHYWVDGETVSSGAKYDTLINREYSDGEYSKVFSLSKSECNYFRLFV